MSTDFKSKLRSMQDGYTSDNNRKFRTMPRPEWIRTWKSSAECRANMAHIRQSRPDSGFGFHIRVLQTFQGVPLLLGSSLSTVGNCILESRLEMSGTSQVISGWARLTQSVLDSQSCRIQVDCRGPLSSGYSTYKTAKARSRTWLSGKRLETF